MKPRWNSFNAVSGFVCGGAAASMLARGYFWPNDVSDFPMYWSLSMAALLAFVFGWEK